MSDTVHRAPSGRERLVAWALLVAVPAVKSVDLVFDTDDQLPTWARQLVIIVPLCGVVWWFVAREPPIGLGHGRRAALALGLWPDAALAETGRDRRWSTARWTLAVAGPAIAVFAVLEVSDGWVRWVLVAAAVTCLVALAALEWVAKRRRADGPPPTTRTATLWVSVPLSLSAISTATTLAAQGDGGKPIGDVASLVVVIAFGEELIFRGCLLALAYRVFRHPATAWLVTSVSFGFWHFGDGFAAGRADGGTAQWVQSFGEVAATFLIGGMAFVFLRIRARGLLAPTYAHIATNLPGLGT